MMELTVAEKEVVLRKGVVGGTGYDPVTSRILGH
jgi:hypothetical protein